MARRLQLLFAAVLVVVVMLSSPTSGAAAKRSAIVIRDRSSGEGEQPTKTTMGTAYKPRLSIREVPKINKHHFEHDSPAQASWDDAISSTGWSWLSVQTNGDGSISDHDQAYSAGYIEGYFTVERIWQAAVNGGVLSYNTTVPHVVWQFLNDNAAWMRGMIQQNSATDPYWYQIDLIMTQLDGLLDGYNQYASSEQQLDYWEMWSLSGGDDIWELIGALTGNDQQPQQPNSDSGAHDHCSAIIKVLPNNADLLITHTSWEGATNMLRTFKRYDFPWSQLGDSTQVPSTSIVFASYPGVLFSGDDYYQTSQQLVIQETTIHTFNMQSLYNQFIRPTTVMDWIRNMLANRMAVSSPDWSQWFARYNSGTYNNAFMVLDYKKFTPGSPILNDTLWLCEQLPGYVTSGDVSNYLQSEGYYASYNVAFWPLTFNLSGTAQMVAQYGDYYSYDRTARALIFARDHTKVVDVDSLKKLIRYNDFKHDPLSACPCDPPYTSLFSISTRQDLDDPSGTYEWTFEGFRNHIGIDAKLTSSVLMKQDLQCWAQSGPTHDTQPVFQWSTSLLANLSHIGMPDRFDFDWELVSL